MLPPAATLTISDAVVRYLELTPGRSLLSRPLSHNNRKKFSRCCEGFPKTGRLWSTASRSSSDHQIKKLAAEQSHIVERLIIANSRLQRNVYEVLAPPQRSKLEVIGQSSTDLSTNLFAQR